MSTNTDPLPKSMEDRRKFYLQEWPLTKNFADLKLIKDYGDKVSESSEYSFQKELAKGNLLIYLDFNTSPYRQDAGTEVLNIPSDARLDFYRGKASFEFNPPLLGMRITDKGQDEVEVFYMSAPYDKHGFTYQLNATHGVVDSISVEEFERPSESNRWKTIDVDPPTIFVYEYDGNNPSSTSIVDVDVIKQLDRFDLPTTWVNGLQNKYKSSTAQTIAPFTELLDRFEDLVKSITKGNNKTLDVLRLLT